MRIYLKLQVITSGKVNKCNIGNIYSQVYKYQIR